jgi:hypothetical protein
MNQNIYLWFYQDQEDCSPPGTYKTALQNGETLAWPESEFPDRDLQSIGTLFQLGSQKVELAHIKVIFIHHKSKLDAWANALAENIVEVVETTGNDWDKTCSAIKKAENVQEVRACLEGYLKRYRKRGLSFHVGLISHRAFTGLATVRMIVDALNERIQERDWGGVKDLLKDIQKDWGVNPEHSPTYYLAELQGMLVGPVKGVLVEPTSPENGGFPSRWSQEDSLEAAVWRECPSEQHNDASTSCRKALEDALTKLAEHAGLRKGCDSQWQAHGKSQVAIYLYGLELLASQKLTDVLRWLRGLPESSDSDVVWLFARQQAGEGKQERDADAPPTVGTEDFDYGAWLKELDRLFGEFQSAVRQERENPTKGKG